MVHRSGAVATLLMLTLLLGACATLPRGPERPLPQVAWAERLAGLQAVEHFTLSGRLAATNSSAGFSAGVRWLQQGDAAHLELVGPMGFGAAHVELVGQTLSVTNGKGVKLEGAAAADELVAMLGFEPPLNSLRYWVVGASDPALTARQSLDPEQRLLHLQQGGWQIDYDEYTQVQQQWLPQRLTVTRDKLRLKLIISAWQL